MRSRVASFAPPEAGFGALTVTVKLASSLIVVLAASMSAVIPAFASSREVHQEASGTWIRVPDEDATPGNPSAPRGDCAWTFSPSHRVHPFFSAQHLWPDVAISPDHSTYGVTWMDDRTGSYRVYYSASTDDGLTWSPPELVDKRTGGIISRFPDLEFAIDGVPVIAWEDDRNSSGMHVFVARRNEGAPDPWAVNRQVTFTGAPPFISYFRNPSLAVQSTDDFFLAYTDWREGDLYQVYGRHTTDGGATWSAETRVSDGLGFEPVAGDPCLVVDPTTDSPAAALFCVTNDWRGNVPGGRLPNVYFYRSTDSGATWSIGVRVNDVESGFQQTSSHALVRLDDGRLTAGFFNSPGGGREHFSTSVSANLGATWSSSDDVDDGDASVYSSIVAVGTTVIAAFSARNGTFDAMLRASADGGETWTEPICRMDDDPGGGTAQNPVVAAKTPIDVLGVWQDSRDYLWDVYSTRGMIPFVGAPVVAPPAASALRLAASPNPSRTGATIRLHVEGLAGDTDAGTAGVAHIVDVSGRRVRRIEGDGGAFTWDGRDDQGVAVAPGIYRARWVSAGGSSLETAVCVLR